MAYIGNTPADKFLTLAKQSFSTSATTSYTLDSAVSSTQDIALFINSVRQSPVDAYTVSGTALTLTSATAGTDEMYCVYLGKTVGTVSPASDSVTTAMIQSNAVNNAKMADDAIGLAELSATGTPSSSNFLRGDNSWASASGETNTPYFLARLDGNQNVTDNTATTIIFDEEGLDSGSGYDTSNGKYTIPSGEGGKYYFEVHGEGDGGGAGGLIDVFVYIMNGGSEIARGTVGLDTARCDIMSASASTLINCSAGDEITCMGKVNNASGSNTRFAGESGKNRTYFLGFKVSS